jgi:hypothetical protein
MNLRSVSQWQVPPWLLMAIGAALVAWALWGGGITPTPDPTPTPAVSALVIENQEERTAAQGIVLGSQRVRAAFPGGFRIEDRNLPNPPADLKACIDRAIPRGLPYLYLYDKDRKLTWEGGLPATIDELLKLKEGGKL